MKNADIARVLGTLAQVAYERSMRSGNGVSIHDAEICKVVHWLACVAADRARAAELDAQKMPGVLDIPGVKDYVNATPPVPDSSTTSDAREQSVSGGSGPAAGLCFSNEWLRKHASKHPDLDDCACPTCGAIAGACANYPNCPSGVRYDDDASKDASGRSEEVGRSGNAGQPDLRSGSQEHALRPERVGRGQHVQQVHAERQPSDDHPEPGATGQVRGGPEVLSGFFASRVACDNYRRPVGILGGPCLNCGQAQPEHYKPAAPSTDDALTVAMKWLEIQSGYVAGKKGYVMPWETQATAILSHIRQQAERIAELTRNYNSLVLTSASEAATLEAERDALRARVAELEAEKERDEVSDWMRACAAQAERIAALRAENERLRAWRTWGKDVALPTLAAYGINASAPKDEP